MQEDMIFWKLEMVENSTKLDHQSQLRRLFFSLAIYSKYQEFTFNRMGSFVQRYAMYAKSGNGDHTSSR
ncbi:hypothetical protein MJO28_017831 [Puccinia striiformis f. sp. tritici]|nr:hypothetical protein MJO28_017831 [Puccinia striiformis f. sp. tritici]